MTLSQHHCTQVSAYHLMGVFLLNFLFRPRIPRAAMMAFFWRSVWPRIPGTSHKMLKKVLFAICCVVVCLVIFFCEYVHDKITLKLNTPLPPTCIGFTMHNYYCYDLNIKEHKQYKIVVF